MARSGITRFLLKAFAKPKSNISFLAIWQKRALARHGCLHSKMWRAKRAKNKIRSTELQQSQMIQIGKIQGSIIRIQGFGFC